MAGTVGGCDTVLESNLSSGESSSLYHQLGGDASLRRPLPSPKDIHLQSDVSLDLGKVQPSFPYCVSAGRLAGEMELYMKTRKGGLRSGVAGKKKETVALSKNHRRRQFHQLKQGGGGCNLVNGCSVGGWRLRERRMKSGDPEKHRIIDKYRSDDSTPSYRERGTGLLTTAYPGSPSCPFLLSGVQA